MSKMRTDEELIALAEKGAIGTFNPDELGRVVTLMKRGNRSGVKEVLDQYAQDLRGSKDGPNLEIRKTMSNLLKQIVKVIPEKHMFELKIDRRSHGILKFTEIHRREDVLENGKPVFVKDSKTGKSKKKTKVVLQDNFESYRDNPTPKIAV